MVNKEIALSIIAKIEHGDDEHKKWLREQGEPLITDALNQKDKECSIDKLRNLYLVLLILLNIVAFAAWLTS